jgi:hypothetical protein
MYFAMAALKVLRPASALGRSVALRIKAASISFASNFRVPGVRNAQRLPLAFAICVGEAQVEGCACGISSFWVCGDVTAGLAFTGIDAHSHVVLL